MKRAFYPGYQSLWCGETRIVGKREYNRCGETRIVGKRELPRVRAFRPDQERKCFWAEFAHIFATRNSSYLTGITFKLSMAFIVLTAL